MKERGLDPKQFLPIAREDTDVWPVYTMPDWLRYQDVLQPIIDQVNPAEPMKGTQPQSVTIAGRNFSPNMRLSVTDPTG